ncbi:MAG: L,D-transpeptidase family protein [Blautia sp.]|nr:L,D-transpeptidase family protein [Blautia sp.]
MKKRIASIVLSLALGLTTIAVPAEELSDGSSAEVLEMTEAPAGEEDAAQMSGIEAPEAETPDVNAVTDVAEEPVEETLETETAPAEETAPSEEAQVPGEELTEDEETVDDIDEDQETFDEEEILSSEAILVGDGESDEETDDGTVKPCDWVRVNDGFKLVRHFEAAAPVVGTDGEEAAVYEPEDENKITDLRNGGTDPVGASEGAAYYDIDDGIVEITTRTPSGDHTGLYLFDENGLMLTGQIVVMAGTPGLEKNEDTALYFTEESAAVVYDGADENAEKTPVTSNVGQQQSSYWLYKDGKFTYYGEDGKEVSIETLAKSNTLGYFAINGAYYALNNDGTPKTGLVTINGASYYFAPDSTIPGQMALDQWVKIKENNKDCWKYFKAESAGNDKGKMETHTGRHVAAIKQLGDGKYFLDKDGALIKSSRLVAENGKYYGSDKNGKIYQDKIVKFGKYRYFFQKDGTQAPYKNCWRRVSSSKNRYYYFGKTAGCISEKSGWQKVTHYSTKAFIGWFYFDSKTHEHYMDRFVKRQYFRPDGKLASGVEEARGKMYYFEPSTAKVHKGNRSYGTFVTYKNKRYYAQPKTGVLVKDGWFQVKNAWYYAENYVVQRNRFMSTGHKGYLDASTGKLTTGWVTVNAKKNQVKYVRPDGTGFYTNTKATIGGLNYHFDKDGYRINDLTGTYKGPYYLRVDRVNGVMTVYTSDGKTPVKSIRVSVGKAGTPTPKGTYYLSRAGRWQMLMGPSWGQYASHVVGAGRGGIFVHSVAGSAPHPRAISPYEYNKLGKPASHGCIRVCVADALWVYTHCNGARINIYDGTYNSSEAFKGPLGRRALVKASSNYDPTDPAI